MNVKEKNKLIEVYPETQEGHREASDKALKMKILNPEHGYYIEKNKGYRVMEVYEPKEPRL